MNEKFIVKYETFREPFKNLGSALRFCKMLTAKGIEWDLVDNSLITT